MEDTESQSYPPPNPVSHLPLGLEDEAGPLRVDRLVTDEDGGFRIETVGQLHRVPVPTMHTLDSVLAGLPNQWDEASMRTLLLELEALESDGQPEDVRTRVRRLRQELLAPLADTIISQRDIITIQHRSSVERERRVCEAMLALQSERDAAIWRIQEQLQPEVAALVAEVENMAATAQEMQTDLHESEAHRLRQEAIITMLRGEKSQLLQRVARDGPRAALEWAREEVLACAARGEVLPGDFDRLLDEASSSGYEEDERRAKKRRVTSPRGPTVVGTSYAPVSFVVPIGFDESKRKRTGLGQLAVELSGLSPDGLLAFAVEAALDETWRTLERIYEKGLPAGLVCAPYMMYQGTSVFSHRMLRRLCYSALLAAKKQGGFAFHFF